MGEIKEWENKILDIISKHYKHHEDLGKPFLIEQLLFLSTDKGRHLKHMMKKNNANKNAVLFLEEYNNFSRIYRKPIILAFNRLLDKQKIHDNGQKIGLGPTEEL